MKIEPKTKPAGATNGVPARTFVKLDQVRPDPEQPRKTFDADKLKDLASSIEQQGIISDLIVCYRLGIKVAEPDMIEKNWQAIEDGTGRVVASGSERDVKAFAKGKEEPWYQIVDGERRWKAAALAGLKEVPVAVRQVDEKMKLALQVVANQQREALSALEEAAAYAKEIESKRHTVESLYKALGISRGTLFSRLVLNRLHPPVRAALEAGKISVSVAGLVAMLPTKPMQDELLEELTNEKAWNYPFSFRDVQQLIDESYVKQLKDAPFDMKGKYPMACTGPGKYVVTPSGEFSTCENCMHRTGNMKAEFPDIKNPNVCTDPACYEVKAQAAASQAMKSARERGQTVLPLDEAAKAFDKYNPESVKHGGKYIRLADRCYEDRKGRTYGQLLGKDHKFEEVLAMTATNRLVPLVEKKAVLDALEKKGVKLSGGGDSYTERWRESEKKTKAKRALMRKAADLALPVLREKLKAMASLEAWRLVARKECFTRGFLERAGIDNKGGRGTRAEMNKHIEKLSEADLRVAVLEAQYADDMVDSWRAAFNEDFEEVCKACRIDLQGLLDQVKAAEKKTPKAKTKTAAGGGASEEEEE